MAVQVETVEVPIKGNLGPLEKSIQGIKKLVGDLGRSFKSLKAPGGTIKGVGVGAAGIAGGLAGGIATTVSSGISKGLTKGVSSLDLNLTKSVEERIDSLMSKFREAALDFKKVNLEEPGHKTPIQKYLDTGPDFLPVSMFKKQKIGFTDKYFSNFKKLYEQAKGLKIKLPSLDQIGSFAEKITPGLNKVAETFGKIGSGLSQVGTKLSLYITAPLAALAAISLKRALELPGIAPIFKEIKAAVTELVRSLAIVFSESINLKGVLTFILNTIKSITNWVKNLDRGFAKFLLFAGFLLAILGPILVTFGSLFSTLGAIVAAISGVFSLIALLAPFAGAIAAVIGPLLIIAGLIGAIVTGWFLFTKPVNLTKFEYLIKIFREIGNSILNWAKLITGFIFNLRTNLGILAEWIVNNWWKAILTQMLRVATMFLTPILTQFKSLFESIGKLPGMESFLNDAERIQKFIDFLNNPFGLEGPKFKFEFDTGSFSKEFAQATEVLDNRSSQAAQAATKGTVDAYSLFLNAQNQQLAVEQQIARETRTVADNTAGLRNLNVQVATL